MTLERAEQQLEEAARRLSFEETPKAAHALRMAARRYVRALREVSQRWHRDQSTSYVFDETLVRRRAS